ncbi:Rad17 cell cycle checkpoint protein-domain-containing protein [Russula brevipes]|nr:Rad17 cell cycle checkpoint protein-domain-containing protein [Russula brevipes]
MPIKPASSGRTKHKSTLKLDSLPPPKKLKAAKGVTILSVRYRLHQLSTQDDCLWVDKFGPRSLQDLAVHKRKVDDVRRWLVEAFDEKGRARRCRLLVLTGPAGSAKTATLRVLAREMDFDVVEYKDNTNTTRFSTFSDEPSTSNASDPFATFLTRAGAYTSVFTSARRKIVLVEDLPNILHPAVRSRFHDAVRAHVERAWDVAPLVLVVSDAGVCAEGYSNGNGGGGSSRARDLVIDARTVVPPGCRPRRRSTFRKSGPFVFHHFALFSFMGGDRQMARRFNPIAPTLLTLAVKRVMTLANVRLLPSALDSIVEGAGGDVRSAIMTLEFSCARPTSSRKQSGKNSAGSLVSVTQKENALLLFHLMGKMMYNKRKGDPPPKSASARDIARDRALDRSLEDPPPLPLWLASEERRASRVDVNTLYASTPIDASLFGLYIHQNYTQYCSSLEQCGSLIDNLSWADANESGNWYDTNPHTFHIQAFGTLHSLPSPVPRTGQRIYKPAFFGALRQEQVARDALERTSSWLSGTGLWSRMGIVTELGGMLRAMGRHAPYGHRAFSELVFGQDSMSSEVMNEGDAEGGSVSYEEGESSQFGTRPEPAVDCGYLEDDDIEEW